MSADLREHLQAIYDEYGKLTPKLVLDLAEDPNHPLHDRFEWDDTAAAKQWRLEQSRELIRSIKVVFRNTRGETREVRKYQSFRAPEGGYRYEPVENVAADPMLSRILLADMERDWRTLKKRYDQYEEFYAMIRGDLDAA